MNMRFYIYSCTLICMKRSEAIDQLREMDAKYSCYVYCKNELAVVLGEQGQKLNRTLSSLVSAKALVRAARGDTSSGRKAVAFRRAGVGKPRKRSVALERDQPDSGG